MEIAVTAAGQIVAEEAPLLEALELSRKYDNTLTLLIWKGMNRPTKISDILPWMRERDLPLPKTAKGFEALYAHWEREFNPPAGVKDLFLESVRQSFSSLFEGEEK